MKKANIILSVLDEIRPDDLFQIHTDPYGELPVLKDQASFDQSCKCSNENVNVTWAEVEAKYAEHESKFAFAEMREQRNLLLKESDVEVLSDRTPSDDILAYRQALRDLPSTENPSYNTEGELQVNWPTKP